jgi:hypothetical protein
MNDLVAIVIVVVAAVPNQRWLRVRYGDMKRRGPSIGEGVAEGWA